MRCLSAPKNRETNNNAVETVFQKASRKNAFLKLLKKTSLSKYFYQNRVKEFKQVMGSRSVLDRCFDCLRKYMGGGLS